MKDKKFLQSGEQHGFITYEHPEDNMEYHPLDCKTITVTSGTDGQCYATLNEEGKSSIGIDVPMGMMPFFNALRGVVANMEKRLTVTDTLARSVEHPIYAKVLDNNGAATPTYIITCDEGGCVSIVCYGLYGWAADWLLEQIQGKPYSPNRFQGNCVGIEGK